LVMLVLVHADNISISSEVSHFEWEWSCQLVG
jgi:hypothetical protein